MDASRSESRALSGLPRDPFHSRYEYRFPWSHCCRAVWLIGLFGLTEGVQAMPPMVERSAIRSSLYDLPLTFEVNQGQTDARVDFLARGQGYTLFLTPTEAVFTFPQAGGASAHPSNGKVSGRPVSDASQPTRAAIRMQLVGSAPDPQVQGLEELPGKVTYFRGNDPAQWRKNVRTFKRVRYASVYPGVDLVYYGQSRQLEYDFIVAPGADPSTIRLAFTGVDDTTIDAQGDLVLKTAGAPLRFQKPVMYQVDRRRRSAIEGGYVRVSPHEVGFHVGSYDRTQPLIIDPVFSYSTYLGGNRHDAGERIAVDATGAAQIIGITQSTDFPTVNALQPALSGEVDVLVAKLTPDGRALIYATYLGGAQGNLGAQGDSGVGIALDPAGNAYITGFTDSLDFPTVRALQATLRGQRDAFVAKLSADGSQLLYSTYLGGSSDDFSGGIAVDLTGAAYVTGLTESTNFPAVNAFQPVCMGRLSSRNAFVAKLTPDGTALAYASYLGGSDSDWGLDIAVDSAGAAYVTGLTGSANFPTVNSVQPYSGSGQDAFVTKLAPNGKSLIYSTHLGGNFSDTANGIAVDMSGAAYVTGVTDSSDFPTANALQSMYAGGLDAFVVKLPPEAGALMYATYLGGSRHDEGHRIAVDAAGAAYLTGITDSFDFPTINALQPAFAGGRFDQFVAKLAPNGAALVHSTYLGGNNDEFGGAIALDLAGAVYVTGTTTSEDFPTVQPLQATLRSTAPFADAFVAKITDDSLGAPAGNTAISGSQNSRSNGGGSLDALLAVLLAQLALARALRQRMRPGR
jgi:hypothetical protein